MRVTIFVDLAGSACEVRQALYDGNLVILTRVPAVTDLVDYTRDELSRLFKPHDPEHAHEHVDKVEMARMLGTWKPAFMHSERAKTLVREIIRQAGFHPTDTHYDVPKPRTSFPQGHLTSGIAYAFPWHRDVWYGAPAQQINWWLPVYPVRDDNSMSFDVEHFAKAIPNTSDSFDYYRNNAQRGSTAAQLNGEVQARPAAVGHRPTQDLVIIPNPGSVLLFAGAHLHASIPNTSGRARYSVDFRTVDVPDVLVGRGAPTVDVYCTGTAIRDFRNVADDSSLDEDTVRQVFGEPPADSMLVFPAPATA
jgi:hypothetical protein